MRRLAALIATLVALVPFAPVHAGAAVGPIDRPLVERARSEGLRFVRRVNTVGVDIDKDGRLDYVTLWTASHSSGLRSFLSVLKGSGAKWTVWANTEAGGGRSNRQPDMLWTGNNRVLVTGTETFTAGAVPYVTGYQLIAHDLAETNLGLYAWEGD
jgi:hypothetical protein